MTTLRDLSRALGLSITQVSRALNNHDDVAVQTRERVQATAREMGYRANVAARRLATGRSGMLGLVLPDVPSDPEDTLFVQIVGTLSQHLSRRGRQFVLHIADPGQDVLEAYRLLTAQGAVDGFVLLDPEVDDRRAAFLRGAGVPFVVHGRLEGVEDYPFYDIDNREVGRSLTELLLHAGHRRIGFVNGPEGRVYARRRHEGYGAALAAAGLAEEPGLHRWGEMTEAAGAAAAEAFWGGPGALWPSAVACGSTRIAEGVLRVLSGLGLRVPDDVSVTVHEDDLPRRRAGALDPPLAGTRSPLSEAWPHLARLLADATGEGAGGSEHVAGAIAVMDGRSVAAPAISR